jgi:hypothetical protein
MPGEREPIAAYLLGVTPNFAAAVAITFVLLSIWADHNERAGVNETPRWFAVFAAGCWPGS